MTAQIARYKGAVGIEGHFESHLTLPKVTEENKSPGEG